MANIGNRLLKLEGVDGAERVIVTCWPGNDSSAALAAKGVVAGRNDLVISIAKPEIREGWVSVDGVRLN